MNGIVIGVISGVIVVIFTWLLRTLWIHVVEPWYEDRVYKDAAVEGAWVISSDDCSDRKERIELFRKGHSVWGDIICTGGPDEGSVYAFEGVFRNTILTGTYKAKNPGLLDRGTYTLLLTRNGMEFEGYAALYSDEECKVVSGESVWKKAS